MSDQINLNFNAQSFQYLAITVSKSNKTFTVCSLYRPHRQHLILHELQTLASRLPTSSIVMGDFNAKSLIWGNSESNRSGDIMELFLQNSDFTLYNDKSPT